MRKITVAGFRRRVSRLRGNLTYPWQAWRAYSWSVQKRQVTLFLATEAGLTPFYATHAVLARVMTDAGHAALILSCRGLQSTWSFKISMGARVSAPGDRYDSACIECRARAREVGGDYGLSNIPLEALLKAEQKIVIDEILKRNYGAPWLTLHDGVNFGAACYGETMRTKGKASLEELDSDDVVLMRALLQAALSIYFSVQILAQRFKIARIVYFGDYAYHIPVQLFAQRQDIALTHISHAYNRDIDRRYVSMLPG